MMEISSGNLFFLRVVAFVPGKLSFNPAKAIHGIRQFPLSVVKNNLFVFSSRFFALITAL
jgi:hypothetical protein